MVIAYQSEIRDSVIRRLAEKVKKNNYKSYLKKIRLNKVRAFNNQEISLDLPVTALIGTNGGGKSTVLGAAAITQVSIKPAIFFPKSSIGDETMADWSIGYDIIDRDTERAKVIQRTASFKKSKWVRDGILDRNTLYFGIQRTVPAGERRDFKKFATFKYRFKGRRTEISETVRVEVQKILGKDISAFRQAAISAAKNFYVGGDGTVTYSEFHFGAGESSVIRMISLIEDAPEHSLVLIEEIENGLHPVAVRKMVEYLIDVSDRRNIQTIFTTHSEDALTPLPAEAIWSSIDGQTRQGKISIEALRAITGRIDERLAIFVEDEFAKDWVEGIVRFTMPEQVAEVGVYAVNGDSQAYSTHLSHSRNPAISRRLRSACILDGNAAQEVDEDAGIIKLTGLVPEDVVFDFVRRNIDRLAMQLAVSMHLGPDREIKVKNIVEKVARDNRDSHLLFVQVGRDVGFISSSIVKSAFITIWMIENPDEVDRISNFIKSRLENAD